MNVSHSIPFFLKIKKAARTVRWFSVIHHGILRRIKEQTIDRIDALYRFVTGNMDMPPYTLRQFVGISRLYKDVGAAYSNEFKRYGLIKTGDVVFDLGCGSGRIAYALGTDKELNLRYVGMDVDSKSVTWCQNNLTRKFPNYSFYHVDLFSKTYNPSGKVLAKSYSFPHADSEFDFIFLTSVFTHLLPEDVEHYLKELNRILKPAGSIYATFFTYRNKSEAVGGVARHPHKFKVYQESYAIVDEDFPEGAVAYQREFLLDLLHRNGLTLKRPFEERFQDVLVMGKSA